jgi:hypothetical protein
MAVIHSKYGLSADRSRFQESKLAIPFISRTKFSVALFEFTKPDSDADDSPKWVQIAEEGDYPGYRNGEQPFSLTRGTFDQLIKNLHANPSYKADDNGIGCEQVIPWDFHHASEMDPTTGEIPTKGVPAQAWTLELEIRESETSKAQLWSLTRFLELARGYIRNGQYQWSSISIVFDMIDPATARNVGAVLTSVALTNQPIVKGMQRMVASNLSYLDYMDPASTMTETLELLKQLLGLPASAGVAELTLELAKLKLMLSSGEAPPGVELDSIIGQMRRLFNLPTLSTVEAVMIEAETLITSLVKNQASQQAVVPATATTTAAAANNKEITVELLKILASRLGVREAADAVEAAVTDLAALQTGIKKLLETDLDASVALLDGVERTAKARTKLTAILKALGIEDADGAVNKIAELMSQAKELASVMPELASLRTKTQKHEEAEAEAEVDGVIAARNYDPEVRDALLMLRKTDPGKFKATYPVSKPGDAHLLSSIVVNPMKKPGVQTVSLQQPLQPVINLAVYPGSNITERAMNYVKATVPGSDKWSHEQLFVAACNLKKEPNVIDQAR